MVCIPGGRVNEGGNASLIEISIAAMIMLGSMGLVATMEPDIVALAPAETDNGYVQSVLDAYLMQGGDLNQLVSDFWDDASASSWFDSFGPYALYLQTGNARILLTETPYDGGTGRAFFTEHATFADNLFTPEIEDVFAPGDAFYSNQGLEYLTGPLGPNEPILSITHRGPSGITSTTFSDGIHGTDWVDTWNEAFANRTIPTNIPYGVWEVQVEQWVLYPIIPAPPANYYWYVLHDASADTSIDHYPTYALELVLP